MLAGKQAAVLAPQLAQLLNEHNNLAGHYSASQVLKSDIGYFVVRHKDVLVGAIGLRRAGYILTEVCHLVVDPKARGFGLGKFLVKKSIELAKTPFLYATVRHSNRASESVFIQAGFKVAAESKRLKLFIREKSVNK